MNNIEPMSDGAHGNCYVGCPNVDVDYRDSETVEVHLCTGGTLELTKTELVDLLIGFGRQEND